MRYVLVFLMAGFLQPAHAVSLVDAGNAPCSTAMELSERAAADTTIGDSLRAAAFALRGDLSFALRDFEDARLHYGRAVELDVREFRYRLRQGYAALAAGDTIGALSALTACAGGSAGAAGREASVAVGEIELRRGNHPAAMTWFFRAGEFSAEDGWSLRAAAGKLACAKALGFTDTASLYEKRLAPFRAAMLELAATKTAGAGIVKRESPADHPYTLQVGAFRSKEYADGVRERLRKTFDAVTCVAAEVKGTTYYRVRVGSFATREDAEAFADRRLRRQGYEYRVVSR